MPALLSGAPLLSFITACSSQCTPIWHILPLYVVMKFLKQFFAVLKKAFQEFVQDDAIKLSASLSYYTVFSIGPLLVIIISLSGIFFGQAAVEGKIYGQLKGLIG